MLVEAHCNCGIPSRYEHECVRRDIPLPSKAEAPKKQRKLSAWPEFFRLWQVGESVVVSWTALQSIKNYAKWLNYKIVWVEEPMKTMDGLAAARVWRVG